jgi:NADPH:quinone reductase-like Zn-dependent oxidoreductase
VLKGRWAGAIDTVGGNILATAIKSAKYGGLIAACGNVGGAEFTSSVYPFILRGVSLVGVDSVEIPAQRRLRVWERLASEWRLDLSGELIQECSLEELSPKIDQILKGGVCGRVVVNLADC